MESRVRAILDCVPAPSGLSYTRCHTM
ncbi:hypothetical protein LINPERHAP2_LOCUS35177 [Linum perenne]